MMNNDILYYTIDEHGPYIKDRYGVKLREGDFPQVRAFDKDMSFKVINITCIGKTHSCIRYSVNHCFVNKIIDNYELARVAVQVVCNTFDECIERDKCIRCVGC